MPSKDDDPYVVTPRQREAYNVLVTMTRELGKPPTFREIAERMGGTSPNPTYKLMSRLYTKGYVTWEADRARTLRVLAPLPAA